MQRWYIDGTVKCFTGGHAALAVLAIIILGLCAALIVVVAAITLEKLILEACVHYISYIYSNTLRVLLYVIQM